MTVRGHTAEPLASPGVNEPSDSDTEAGLGRVLVTAEEIDRRVAELGAEISRDYAGRSLLLVGVLRGAVLFVADLCRHIDLPVELDFMAVSSYGSATRTSGVVRIIKDLDTDIGGRDVLLVEDIVDSGLTAKYLQKTLRARQPASLEICSLLQRRERTAPEGLVRYTGFHLADDWVVGYGLDVAQRYRNLQEIRAFHTERVPGSDTT